MMPGRRPMILPASAPSGTERALRDLARRVRKIERAPTRQVFSATPIAEQAIPPTTVAIPYLLLGAFYADLNSVSLCDSDGVSLIEEALADVLVEASSGVAGAGFLVALADFTVDVYDRNGILALNFDANSGGTTFTTGVFVAGSSTHIYAMGNNTLLKRFTAAGVFVDEANVDEGGTEEVLAGKRDADEVWVGTYMGSSNWKITRYVNMVAGIDYTIDLSVPVVSAPENIDIDEDGFMYGLCVRDDGPGWRVIKVDLSDGSVSDLADGSDVSAVRLSVGGRDKPSARADSMVYVAFQGASAGNGLVEIRDAGDGSLISTVEQSVGTDSTWGVARQKVS